MLLLSNANANNANVRYISTLLMTNFKMTDEGGGGDKKVVPRAAVDLVRQLKTKATYRKGITLPPIQKT